MIALLLERLRRILKKIIRKLHPIGWLRQKFGFPGGENGQSEADIELGKKEDEILSKMEELIDTAIDISRETAYKTLAEKLNAAARS